jgi:glycosyltransferase involved in cell wall biosynthesis
MDSPAQISVIVTTYARPKALSLVLRALAIQSCPEFEVVVAEDGIDGETEAIVRRMTSEFRCPIKHVRHEDKGFRVATIRNKAVARSSGDYLVFLDGDCIPRRDFVERHSSLAEAGWFVTGRRARLTRTFTEEVEQNELSICEWNLFRWTTAFVKGQYGPWSAFWQLPLSKLASKTQATKWRGAAGCNMAIWRKDFLAVNGFDEAFEGWGFEDTELALRLINLGRRRIKCYFGIPVIHLWHPPSKRRNTQKNMRRALEHEKERLTRAETGVDRHLENSAALSVRAMPGR